MKILVFEHHRYRSTVPVGSHRFADEFRRRKHEVVWFSHPRTTLHRIRGALPPTRTRHDDGVTEIVLRAVAPYIEFPLLNSVAWGKRWLAGNIGLLEDLNLDHCDLLWMSDFTMLGILDLIEASNVVFRFFDRIEKYEKMPRTIFELVEHHRTAADLVIASSAAVCGDLKNRGIDAYHVPNAVDSHRFPRDLAVHNGRPERVIYVGALRSWFDFSTVTRWAAALPNVEFMIVGPNDEGLHSSLPNLKIEGAIPSPDVPRLLATARFGIIPFKVNDLTQGVHPIKLYEYLASGCMVLSAALPDVHEIEGAVFTYQNPEEGIAILEKNLTRTVDRQRLHSIAMAQSWAHRVDDVSGRLGVRI